MIFIFFTRQIPFHPAEETHIYRNEYFCPWLGHLGNSKKNGSFDGKWQVRKRQIVIQIFQQSWLLHNLMSMSWTKCKMKCLKLQSYISPSPFTRSVTRMAIIKNNLLVYLPFWSNPWPYWVLLEKRHGHCIWHCLYLLTANRHYPPADRWKFQRMSHSLLTCLWHMLRYIVQSLMIPDDMIWVCLFSGIVRTAIEPQASKQAGMAVCRTSW